MTEILKKAKEIGALIREDPITIKLFAAKDAYEHDEELNTLLTEYNVQQQALTNEYAKEEPDPDISAAIEKRINELSDAVMSHPLFTAYGEAESEYRDLMKLVNDEINFQVTGKRSCSGDCSACGGCATEE